MGEIIPIERAFDRRNEKNQENHKLITELIEDLENAKETIVMTREHPHTANAEYINKINVKIAEIDNFIALGKKMLEESDEIMVHNFKKKVEFIKKRKPFGYPEE